MDAVRFSILPVPSTPIQNSAPPPPLASSFATLVTHSVTEATLQDVSELTHAVTPQPKPLAELRPWSVALPKSSDLGAHEPAEPEQSLDPKFRADDAHVEDAGLTSGPPVDTLQQTT